MSVVLLLVVDLSVHSVKSSYHEPLWILEQNFLPIRPPSWLPTDIVIVLTRGSFLYLKCVITCQRISEHCWVYYLLCTTRWVVQVMYWGISEHCWVYYLLCTRRWVVQVMYWGDFVCLIICLNKIRQNQLTSDFQPWGYQPAHDSIKIWAELDGDNTTVQWQI